MSTRPVRFASAILAIWLLGVLAGCAGPSSVTQGPVFFPPSPSLPRLQYLMGINSSADVEGAVNTYSLVSFGKEKEKVVRPIIKPYGVTAAGNKVYVADIAGQVAIMDLAKKKFELLKGDKDFGKLKKPVGVTLDESGFIYVADVGRKEILIYDPEGEYLRAVGGELGVTPADVAVDLDRIYILDNKGAIIKALDRVTGAFITDLGDKLDAENRLSLPINFTLGKNGIFHITNAGSGRVISLDRDGNFLGAFGKMGDGFGQFSRPKGIAVDDKGEIFVVDAGFQNTQIFNEKGRLLMYFGSNTLPVGGMNLPAGITLSNADLPFFQQMAEKNFELEQVVFVTNQYGNPKISVYGLGKLRGVDYEKEYRRLQEEREMKAKAAIEKARKAQAAEEKAMEAVQPEAAKP